jgi:hypothetical protein
MRGTSRRCRGDEQHRVSGHCGGPGAGPDQSHQSRQGRAGRELTGSPGVREKEWPARLACPAVVEFGHVVARSRAEGAGRGVLDRPARHVRILPAGARDLHFGGSHARRLDDGVRTDPVHDLQCGPGRSRPRNHSLPEDQQQAGPEDQLQEGLSVISSWPAASCF